ncbi:MAG: putative transcriptional regulator [Actinomycetota bacterium]|nr:putative transcriptional regulator [Actinomycetota bacterium]
MLGAEASRPRFVVSWERVWFPGGGDPPAHLPAAGGRAVSEPGAPDGLRGRLLVATPSVGDPNFAGTVVLMLEHSDDGAMGVVLNRPSEIDVALHLPGWTDVVVSPSVVFLGGPVSPNAALCLARVESYLHEGWDPLVGQVGTVDLNLDPDRAVPGVAEVRIFAGYAGWAPRQVEAEIADGGWFVVDADPGDALSPEPDELWRDVLRRQKGTVSLFADYPEDPAMN